MPGGNVTQEMVRDMSKYTWTQSSARAPGGPGYSANEERLMGIMWLRTL